MKKFAACSLALALAMLMGCTPSAEQIKNTAIAIGYAAGLVANQTEIKDDARNAIVEVLNEVRRCIPAEGRSFAEAWEPVIKEKVDALVKAGKIDAATGELVKTVALMATKGVDYLFDIRFPKAKQYEELVCAGVDGALDGFLEVFRPANHAEDECSDCLARGNLRKNYDKEAYEWFQKNLKK